MNKIITSTFKETQKVGSQFADKIKNGGIIALYGNLGSGKTTFVQGLAQGLGIKNKIISPTFIIIRKYILPTTNYQLQTKFFFHIDLYRIESAQDLQGLGLDEILNDPTNIVAIEWPEKIANILPKKTTNLFFEYLGENKREISSKGRSAFG